MRHLLACLGSLALFCGTNAYSQISDDVVRIGVLTDMSGIFSTASGAGSVLAAQMAVEDFGGTVHGKRIEVIAADHQNKPDVGANIIRRWFDSEQVDAVTDLPVSSIALAAQEIARTRKKTLLISGGATSDLYGKACSPYSTIWSDDTYAVSAGTAKAILDTGANSWFFITVDFAFGHALERDASQVVMARGGEIKGRVRHPMGQQDLSSFLLQAQASKAKVIGLANVGSDTSNALKQAKEFAITRGGQKLAAFLVFLTDIDAIGLDVAQGLYLLDGFYWDQNDAARGWSERFLKRHGRMPTKEHAATYSAVLHYLKAIKEVGTDEVPQVNEKMRELPVEHFGKSGVIRPDGRVLYDMTLYQVKSPAESKGRWDYQKPVATIDKDQAFRPLGGGECSLTK